MNADQAAQVSHDWAAVEGLLADGPRGPVLSGPTEFAQIQPITEAGKQILRAKQIEAIAFNIPRPEIIAFTKRVAPASGSTLTLASRVR
jgi:hypothetical protein